jgi:hypothetical protein
LIRNLTAERPEALEQLLVLSQSYAPELFRKVEKLADAVRHGQGSTAELFREMRSVYDSVVNELTEGARGAVVDGRIEDALQTCDSFLYGLEARELRNEILAQSARWKRLRQRERQGRVSDDAELNELRANILSTIDLVAEMARVPKDTPRPEAPIAETAGLLKPASPKVEDIAGGGPLMLWFPRRSQNR